MKQKTNIKAVPYSNLVDNIKVLLIFLVVFNHIIAFQLVKADIVIRYVWYAITIFHMPAFIFVSGYLSKKPQSALKNVKNLLIPYILGYSLTWYSRIWLGEAVDYEILRPSGTVMWYLLALFVYRLTIEATGKIRFILPVSIIIALWAGTRPEFTTYVSSSRIVVFFPFFVAGYLWKSEYTDAVRRFKGKWVLIPISGLLLYAVPNYMITHDMPVDIFRGNHSYLLSGLTDEIGIVIRLLMYLVSFALVLTFFALMPDRRLPLTFIGRNTMGIYFFHYPVLIIADGLLLLSIPELLNVWVLAGVSLVIVLILGSPVVDWLYTGCLNLITFVLFKKEKKVRDEGLQDEYDGDAWKYEVIRKRRQAIEELAATLETEREDTAGGDAEERGDLDTSEGSMVGAAKSGAGADKPDSKEKKSSEAGEGTSRDPEAEQRISLAAKLNEADSAPSSFGKEFNIDLEREWQKVQQQDTKYGFPDLEDEELDDDLISRDELDLGPSVKNLTDIDVDKVLNILEVDRSIENDKDLDQDFTADFGKSYSRK